MALSLSLYRNAITQHWREIKMQPFYVRWQIEFNAHNECEYMRRECLALIFIQFIIIHVSSCVCVGEYCLAFGLESGALARARFLFGSLVATARRWGGPICNAFYANYVWAIKFDRVALPVIITWNAERVPAWLDDGRKIAYLAEY